MTHYFRLLRPRQWIKNLFVAAPLFFTSSLWTFQSFCLVGTAFLAFCFVSSAIYILNDIVDRDADKQHAIKKNRPLAADRISVRAALILFFILLGMGGGLSFFLGPVFITILFSYFAIQFLYCFWLKHIALIDVMVIAVGFVLRVLAGAAVIHVVSTSWIIIMTTLLALFQGLAKRRDDLVRQMDASHRRSLKGYNKTFLDVAISVILGSLLVAYLIFTTDDAVVSRFGTDRLFYTAPLVILGILRYLQITLVEENSGSPTEVVLQDTFMLASIIGWTISFLLVTHVPF